MKPLEVNHYYKFYILLNFKLYDYLTCELRLKELKQRYLFSCIATHAVTI